MWTEVTCLELGYLVRGTEVELRCEDDGNPTLQAEVWRFDTEAFKEFYEKMDRESCKTVPGGQIRSFPVLFMQIQLVPCIQAFLMIRAGNLQ